MTEPPRTVYVYCDESRHDPGPGNLYMGLGSLWIPASKKDDLHRRLRGIAEKEGLGAEIKWSKVSDWALEKYARFLRPFFEDSEMLFRVIIVEQERLDFDTYHGGDAELGFYKFYYELLIKWFDEGEEYIILLDHKANSEPGRYGELGRVLERAAPSGSSLRRLSVIPNSADSYLAQMTDLLTGAATAAWCGYEEASPKARLAGWIAENLGKDSLRQISPTPEKEKFNVFRIRLSAPAE